MICNAVSESFVTCARFLQMSWLFVRICLWFQTTRPFSSKGLLQIFMLCDWLTGAAFALRLGERMFQTGSQKCNMQRCSSVIWYLGLSLTPCFCFISRDWYPPHQVCLQARKTDVPQAFGVVKSLLSEQVAFMAPAWILGTACVWSVCGSPSADRSAATAGGQPLSWEVRKSQTGVALGSVNCQDVWIS